MTPYRCGNPKCKKPEFTSDKPICPACGLDGTNPRYAAYVTRLEVIHFDPPDPIIETRGMGYCACDPNLPSTGGGRRSTAAHAAVTCKACIDSEAFVETYTAPIHSKLDVGDGCDAEVLITPAGVQKKG